MAGKPIKAIASQTDFYTAFALIAAILFFALVGTISYLNVRTLSEDTESVARTHEVITGLQILVSTVKDAETGQRGYLLTGDDSYLEPYQTALGDIDRQVKMVDEMLDGRAEEQAKMLELKKHIASKLKELIVTIELRRTKGADAALAIIRTGHGKQEMDAIRAQVSAIELAEQEIRKARLMELDKAYETAVISGVLVCVLGIVISIIMAGLVSRVSRKRRREEWLQNGQVGLAKRMVGDQRLEELGENILEFLAEYMGAYAGAFFVKETSEYKRVAMYGVPDHNEVPQSFIWGNGLLGQAAKDNKMFLMHDVPENYLTIGSGLTHGRPKHLAIAPVSTEEMVNGVLELGFIHAPSEISKTLLEQLAGIIGIAVRTAQYRSNLQDYLEETQRQAEELQSQAEELRVNNEELEEQGRAMKESQARLEQQQIELEQTNSQLEEQTQMLESQRDELERSQVQVEQKAHELEQASQYKSDFLANMSHELRTPLNSSLILAKLLADNKEGNLTEEQIKFAQTIQSSGNDLLALINDILDLSKIEAGHMELRPETITLDRLMQDMTRLFEPVAQQKKLAFHISHTSKTPKTIETDRLRLEQILKNLLSNALKFTEEGSITLNIDAPAHGKISFAVTDTGIGIGEEYQQAIFDAFRQADGTINRKYGGTGLGLSISRELTRLLGGQIQLSSEPGKGSTFTVTIPVAYDPNDYNALPIAEVEIKKPLKTKSVSKAKPLKEKPKFSSYVDDDRERLTGDTRIILVVEDDLPFARILYDLTKELGFQCLIANTADDALLMTRQYMPSAILLDIGLPDNSGLSVLDRLKRDARTRHIPVHVITATDHTQTVLSLGAVGHELKPVKREDLVKTLKGLETRLSKRVRRILIVEDDEVQRESLCKLLGSSEVRPIAVGTAAECLEQLKSNTFDCMVLDLSLSDASGYSLLETLSREEAYSFPPVIVYTGHSLTHEEEERLRRYSKSIIIKGAKSPERLLDEVTLFLHQVVADLPSEQQRMLEQVRNRDDILEDRHILVVEDDVRNVFALTSIFEPLGATVRIARNGYEAIDALKKAQDSVQPIDLVLMDVMMPEMDGLTATREIRRHAEWKKLPIIMLTAKAMKDDQERCLDAGANDYMAKPLDVEKLLSLVRVWMPR